MSCLSLTVFILALLLCDYSSTFAQPIVSSVPLEGTKAGQERDDNGLKLKLIWCPAGNFTMGSPATEQNRSMDEGQAQVTLSRGFWLGRYEVTQGQWQQVMGTTPWKARDHVKEGPDYPATFVSWDDADAFGRKLTDSERQAGRLPAAWKYDLPSEAQWEYACRAGKTTRFSFGDNESALAQYAWYVKNTWDVNEKYAHQVGQKLANAWGLQDMHGNVWEWCRDLYQEKHPGGRDPEGISGSLWVCRGGGWSQRSVICRSANRLNDLPNRTNFILGFRVARVPLSE